MIGFSIDVRDSATPVLNNFIQGMDPRRLAPVAGRSARNTVRDYLFEYNGAHGNRLGGPRTNYYTGAARGTQFKVEGDIAIVSINQVGFAQRYYGGTIKPVTKKFLTLPARAEAYGKRASEFPDLVVLFGRNGPYALARKVSRTALKVKLVKTKQTGRFKQEDVTTSSQQISGGDLQGGEILFWLVKSVTQSPNPNVVPSNAELGENIRRDVGAYAKRLWERKNPAAAESGGDT